MDSKIDTVWQQFSGEAEKADSVSHVEELKVKYLGRKGSVQQLMQTLKEIEADERPAYGKGVNELKERIMQALEEKRMHFILKEENERIAKEKIDLSLPGYQRFSGRKHIVTQTMDKMIDTLSGMGFSVQYGPDIDSDYYNFGALNFPPDHPARDMQDTFYLSADMLLRTQTSNIQARVMELQKPPIRIIAPGKVFRNETITMRSHVFFHQVDTLYIDRDVTFADLFATMSAFLEKFFESPVSVRFRPSYFPFVEPGMEVDIRCLSCDGQGCPLCKQSGWLEVAGAGMVHPEVLKNGDIDPEEYTGFAWGMGVERLILLKNGVTDIRLFTENNLRFLNQF